MTNIYSVPEPDANASKLQMVQDNNPFSPWFIWDPCQRKPVPLHWTIQLNEPQSVHDWASQNSNIRRIKLSPQLTTDRVSLAFRLSFFVVILNYSLLHFIALSRFLLLLARRWYKIDCINPRREALEVDTIHKERGRGIQLFINWLSWYSHRSQLYANTIFLFSFAEKIWNAKIWSSEVERSQTLAAQSIVKGRQSNQPSRLWSNWWQ